MKSTQLKPKEKIKPVVDSITINWVLIKNKKLSKLN